MVPTIAVLIRTFNEEEWVGRVIDRVLAQTLVAEVIVVDSGSRDHTLDEVRSRPTRVVEMAPGTFTYGRALNQGFAATDADIVVALSAHALPVDEEWLARLVAPFADAEVAATYGQQIPHVDLDPFRARDITDYWRPIPRLDRPGAVRFSNANGAVRRSRWEVDRFDETMPYSEDREWAEHAVRDGLRVEYVPAAAVYHSHSEGPLRCFRRHRNEAMAKGDPPRGWGETTRRLLRESVNDARSIAKHPRKWVWAPASPVIRAAQVLGDRAGARAAAGDRARPPA